MTKQLNDKCLFTTFIKSNWFLRPIQFLKKNLAILILISVFNYSFSQKTDSISGQYSSAPIEVVISDIEKQTNYQFFFLEPWTEGITISTKFENDNLNNVLDSILADTSLNYYILETQKRIILLENTIVYDQLPNGFFGYEAITENNSLSQTKTKAPQPTFYTTNSKTAR
ncbi:MAG: hypothetical protein ABJI22_04435, partial [Maribacter sp.]